MKIYLTNYALSLGVRAIEAEQIGPYEIRTAAGDIYEVGIDAFFDRTSAMVDAEARRVRQLRVLTTHLDLLKNREIEIHELPRED